MLERARDLGFLGPAPVDEHVSHAARFGDALDRFELSTGRVADIGSGAGVPGLALLATRPELSAVLIDAAQRRCSFLVWAVAELGIGERAEIWCGRAEEIGHEARARERFDGVVARGFGPPATTLECATGLVRPGGLVVVSEPPLPRRWPEAGLASLALRQVDGGPGVAVFERLENLSDELPRPSKQQRRRPFFDVE